MSVNDRMRTVVPGQQRPGSNRPTALGMGERSVPLGIHSWDAPAAPYCRSCLKPKHLWHHLVMVIDLRGARQLAEQELEPLRTPEDDLIFLDDMTEDVPEGWVFFWDDRRHVETGEMKYAQVGGGPIFVSRSGDLVHMVWSGESWEIALARYRATGSMRETWKA